MKPIDKIKIFVIEDNVNWRDSLCHMFMEIMPHSHIDSAISGRDALRRIENGDKYDLLSVDINLGSTHPKTEAGTPDLDLPGADGRAVLHRAWEKHTCNGIIVITGLTNDTTLDSVIPYKEERMRVKMNISSYLNKLFPQRYLYFQKIPECTIKESIDLIRKDLNSKEILNICKAIHFLPPRYTIESSGDYIKPNIVIKSDKCSVPITNVDDARFLFYLCDVKKTTKPYIEKKRVCSIYRKLKENEIREPEISQYAESDIFNLKRRLIKEGLQPKSIIKTIRNIGWKLNDDIILRGFASVDTRSKNNSNISIENLPNGTATDFDISEDNQD